MADAVAILFGRRFPTSKVRIRSLIDGLRRHGIRTEVAAECTRSALDGMMRAELRGAKLVCCFTSGMQARHDEARAWAHEQGVNTLVTDLGYIRRATGPHDHGGYNQAGWNRIGWVPPTAGDSGERWAALGVSVAPGRRVAKGRPIAVLSQVAHDSQHRMGYEELGDWLVEAEAEARKAFPGLGETLWRCHPLQHWGAPRRHWRDVSRQGTLRDLLDACGLVVTYNSTAGVEAILAGAPVWCDEGAHYAAVARASRPKRLAYLRRLAWAQWTCDELRDGSAWEFLRQWA